jgi:hypothetical protein
VSLNNRKEANLPLGSCSSIVFCYFDQRLRILEAISYHHVSVFLIFDI